ncbi:unnamed protein product [marine sediment metagenome]|uniref:Uncharacterized protein n=1 Tax=marine sediment metagenome TaxID=412755 RepID=X0S3Q5_9ZZZZ
MDDLDEMYCYEDELPCELTDMLFERSIVDGVRLYPWKAVAKQLEAERNILLEYGIGQMKKPKVQEENSCIMCIH